MDDGFAKERIRLIQNLAERADSFTKRRLLDLVKRYDDSKLRPLSEVPYALANLPSQSNRLGQDVPYLGAEKPMQTASVAFGLRLRELSPR